MSATSHGIGCGVVIGIVVVVLAQQLGFLELSNLSSALIDPVVGAVVGALVGGAIGHLIGRRVREREAARASRAPASGTS